MPYKMYTHRIKSDSTKAKSMQAKVMKNNNHDSHEAGVREREKTQKVDYKNSSRSRKLFIVIIILHTIR